MKIIYMLLIALMVTMPAFAQGHNSNDTIRKMQTELNLSQKQVFDITPVIDKYSMAFEDLQKSIDDGTMNPSAIDSQRKEIQSEEDQEVDQYLTANQITQWNYISSQMDHPKNSDSSDDNADNDIYSNLPRDIPSQN